MDVDIGGLVQPRIEPEVQVHFARTPPVTHDEHAILDAIDWISLGFEIVHCPFADWNFMAADAIAAHGVHGLLVVGPKVPVEDIPGCRDKLRSFTIDLHRDGQPVASGRGANVLDSPLLAIAHLISVLADQPRFAPLQAGEVVTTGTLTELFPAVVGETWNCEISGIELLPTSMHLVAET